MEVAAEIPDAKFLYLYRDPRDFILSQMKRPGAVKSVARYSKLWAYEQTKAIAVSERLRSKNRCFFVSYETLISEEKNTIERILEFLNVDHGKGKEYQDDIQEDVHEWSNLDSETKKDNSGKFLKELSKKKLALAESICYRQMSYFGYQRVSDSSRDPRSVIVYLDILLGFAKKKIASIFSKADKSSAVYKRQALLSKMKINYRSDIL
jgi:ubiquitin C-terminal hydrolase